jgi:hypothetical protein
VEQSIVRARGSEELNTTEVRFALIEFPPIRESSACALFL